MAGPSGSLEISLNIMRELSTIYEAENNCRREVPRSGKTCVSVLSGTSSTNICPAS